MFNKKTSSSEFLKEFENMYKEGPKVNYKNPDAWNTEIEHTN